MYKRYYDGYGPIYQKLGNDRGEVVIPKTNSEETASEDTQTNEEPKVTTENEQMAIASHRGGLSAFGNIGKVLDDIAIDDIILFGVILLVLKDSSDDPLLIIILTVIFLAGILDD